MEMLRLNTVEVGNGDQLRQYHVVMTMDGTMKLGRLYLDGQQLEQVKEFM